MCYSLWIETPSFQVALSVKRQKKREHRLVRAKVKNTSSLGFSDSVPAPFSLPGVSDLISEISSSLSPCPSSLGEDLSDHFLTFGELGKQIGISWEETAEVSVGDITSEHESFPAWMRWSLGLTGPFVTKALFAFVQGFASAPTATTVTDSTPASVSFMKHLVNN